VGVHTQDGSGDLQRQFGPLCRRARQRFLFVLAQNYLQGLLKLDTGAVEDAPVPAPVCAIKLTACCCTRRYSMVCSGRWRSWWSGRGGAGRAAPDPTRAGRRRAFNTVGVRRSPGPHSVARVAERAYTRRDHSSGGL
jgi:hypothetical protein